MAVLASCRPPDIAVEADAGGGKRPDLVRGGDSVDASSPALLPDVGFALLPDASLVDRASCGPVTCKPTGGQYCGTIGDGCGSKLDCGECPAGETCGGGGVPKLCGKPADPNCKPITCTQVGGQLCGRVGNGCGGALDCGACASGEMCGATIANVCGAGAAVCDSLCQQQTTCPAGQDTTVSGTVFAPTPAKLGAADPLYNVLVYVPNGTVKPFASGVACEQCGQVSGSPLVTALTEADGKFTLKHVPVGDNIPLVIQIGRWRRQVKIPKVSACTNTALPAELTRLPRNQAEGDIPRIAIATGAYDAFDCTLRKLGIDDAEFTVPTGNGRVNVWAYGGHTVGAATPPGAALLGSLPTLSNYDMLVLPCDDDSPKVAAQTKNLSDYADKGGRIFFTDFSYSWLRDTAPFASAVVFKKTLTVNGNFFTTVVDQTFPKGMAFALWLNVVGASPMLGSLAINDPYGGTSYVDSIVAPAQRWLYTDGTKKSIQHLTFNTPTTATADKQCGRVVFSQFHVTETTVLDPTNDFPKACDDRPMTPQEKALEFMIFDASACIQPDAERPRVFEPPPLAPPPPPPA